MAAGLPELLSRISAKLEKENATDLSQRSVYCTAGSNMAFLNTIGAIADPGDEIILLTPYYFNHHMAVEIAGCRPVCVPTDEHFQPDLKRIESAISPRTRAVVSVSPNNPTGAVYPRESLIALNGICKRHSVFHIHDEAYEYFTFGDTAHFSPTSLDDSTRHTISLFSLSKAYAMAGWRIGYAVIPDHLDASMRKVQDTNLICPPISCQLAACAALDAGRPWCDQQIGNLSNSRVALTQRLSQLGERCRLNQTAGAFYLLLTLNTQQDDTTLVESLIREYGVATLPGSTFGIQDRCVLRISYGGLNSSDIQSATDRLIRGLERLI